MDLSDSLLDSPLPSLLRPSCLLFLTHWVLLTHGSPVYPVSSLLAVALYHVESTAWFVSLGNHSPGLAACARQEHQLTGSTLYAWKLLEALPPGSLLQRGKWRQGECIHPASFTCTARSQDLGSTKLPLIPFCLNPPVFKPFYSAANHGDLSQ